MRNQMLNLNQDILNWVNQCNESREEIKIKDNVIKEKNKDISTTIADILNHYEKNIEIPDSITVTSVNYPYRSEKSYRRLVESHYESAMLPTLFGWEEKRSCFVFGGDNEIAINNKFERRQYVDSGVLICSIGFGCTANPSSFRDKKFLNQRVNIIPVEHQKELFEINKKEDLF